MYEQLVQRSDKCEQSRQTQPSQSKSAIKDGGTVCYVYRASLGCVIGDIPSKSRPNKKKESMNLGCTESSWDFLGLSQAIHNNGLSGPVTPRIS
jgi:hypothetical protein